MNTTWRFNIGPDTAVVTSSYVTRDRLPILLVSHEDDPDEGPMWQFHAGNGDFSGDVLQLVRLDEILAIDPGLQVLHTLPSGSCAERADVSAPWVVRRDPQSDQ